MYMNFCKYSVAFDLERSTFSVYYDGMGEIVREASITKLVSKLEPQVSLSDYAIPKASKSQTQDQANMIVTYSGENMMRQDVSIHFSCSKHGVRLFIGGEGTSCVEISGLAIWGKHDQTETMAVNLQGAGRAIRSAMGPAASIHDNALFDRDTDTAVVFESAGTFRLQYDWGKDCFAFSMNTMGWDFARGLNIYVKKHVYEDAFNVDYKKINHNTVFKTPPVGWMSWYSVQFEAGDKTVLENTKWQEENLKRYGADTIWVDWEWYHPDFSSHAPADVDMFHPNKRMYPHGLKYIADQIKKAGFIPALWVAPTCDPTKNEMIQKYPDMVMAHKAMWCGQYFLDVTHPKFLDEVLPKMLQQPLNWGYKAIKWDVLPNTTMICDDNHATLSNNQISSREAMIGAFRKAREILGKDYYMLYCAGVSDRDGEMACSVFDAMRIGGDIFRWDTFFEECIDKVHKYYPLHDVVINNDPDNVVLREKFNTLDQAITRSAYVSLLGMPFTLGDNLPELPEERVEILRRSIPPIPAHPMDIRSNVSDHTTEIVNLAVERPDMRFNVADIINLKTEPSTVRIHLKADLGLDNGAYYVYDYWNKELLGVFDEGFSLELRACASRILSVHKVEDKPQVISTSRHIAQGALDLIHLQYDAEKMVLIGESKVVGGEDYGIVVAYPDTLRVFGEGNHTTCTDIQGICDTVSRCTFHPTEDGIFHWEIAFMYRTLPIKK